MGDLTRSPLRMQVGSVADIAYSKRWHTREDSGIRLDRNLVWWHDDERVEHPKIIETFNTSLQPTEDGKFQLHIGKDWCFVEVEDAAYRVNAVDVSEDGALYLRLSDRTGERCDVQTLKSEDGVLTCRVKAGKAKALFSRDAQFALGELLVEEGGGFALRLGTRTVPIPSGVLLQET